MIKITKAKKSLREIIPDLFEGEHSINYDRYIPDGVYDITGIPYLDIPDSRRYNSRTVKKIEEFNNKHSPVYLAKPYQTYQIFLLGEKPKEIFSKNLVNPSYSHGAAGIIENCPKTVMILAEDD